MSRSPTETRSSIWRRKRWAWIWRCSSVIDALSVLTSWSKLLDISSNLATSSGWSWPVGLTSRVSSATADARSWTAPAIAFQSSARIASPACLWVSGRAVSPIDVTVSRTGPRLASGMSSIGVLRNCEGSITTETRVSPEGRMRIGRRTTGRARLGCRIASS